MGASGMPSSHPDRDQPSTRPATEPRFGAPNEGVAAVQIKISARHGHLDDATQQFIREKAEKLLHFFGRITMIEVTVDFQKDLKWVEFNVQAEAGMSFPNPNTKNEVFVDDMEGVRDAVSLSLTPERWLISLLRRANWVISAITSFINCGKMISNPSVIK